MKPNPVEWRYTTHERAEQWIPTANGGYIRADQIVSVHRGVKEGTLIIGLMHQADEVVQGESARSFLENTFGVKEEKRAK